ncbi:MAG: CopG family transcriptional regulator [Gallionellaceae bacterium]|nr:CopG family transcriptional regulator [Gallionellaceae bacterium]
MQVDTLEIQPEIRADLHALAEEIHRGETEILNEALAAYLAHERRAIARMREGLAQAEKGEFVPDDQMEAFFSRYAD